MKSVLIICLLSMISTLPSINAHAFAQKPPHSLLEPENEDAKKKTVVLYFMGHLKGELSTWTGSGTFCYQIEFAIDEEQADCEHFSTISPGEFVISRDVTNEVHHPMMSRRQRFWLTINGNQLKATQVRPGFEEQESSREFSSLVTFEATF